MKNSIPLTEFAEAFSKMQKKSAAHRDGWTRMLLRDVGEKPSTALHLRKFIELFSNGALSKNLGPT